MKKFKQLAIIVLAVVFLTGLSSCASKKGQGCPTFSFDLIDIK